MNVACAVEACAVEACAVEACAVEKKSVVVAGTYRLIKKIGEGSFGKIFAAKNKITGEEVAVKLIKTEHKTIWENEINILERLKEVKNIPSLYAAGAEGQFNYIVMDLLEQNLEQLKTSYGANLTMKVILQLGMQMLTVVEAIHSKGIIHRDIKPANFLLKTNKQNISELYLIDFGLACSYVTDEKKHIQMRTNKPLIGTTRYMSINAHQGITASRKDDLESLGYILVYLSKGELPWQNSGEMALAIKQSFGWTYGSVIVGEFLLFIQYCRGLPFADQPKYDYLRTILTNLAQL